VRRLPFAAIVALLLSATQVIAQPQPPQPGQPQGVDGEQLLQIAERYYEQLEYEEALKVLIKVHQVPGVTPMQRARSFLYMGVCFTALGNAENATLSFMELLKVKPNFRLPAGISPSIQQMFKEALLRMKLPEQAPPTPAQPPEQGGAPPGEIPVKLVAKFPGKVAAGQPVEVSIELEDPRKLVQGVQVRWRRVGGPDFSSIKVPFTPGTRQVEARIPGATVGTEEGRLQFMVEATGRGGMTLAHDGSMDEPKVVELTAPKKPRSKWGWWLLGIGGGAAVVGGVVAAVLLTRGGNGNGQSGMADVSVVIH